MTFEGALKMYNSIEDCEQKSWKTEYRDLEKLDKNIAIRTYSF